VLFDRWQRRRTRSGDEERIEWAKIRTPTDEVVVPYDALESPPEGSRCRLHQTDIQTA
jgi:hypothetical protein